MPMWAKWMVRRDSPGRERACMREMVRQAQVNALSMLVLSSIERMRVFSGSEAVEIEEYAYRPVYRYRSYDDYNARGREVKVKQFVNLPMVDSERYSLITVILKHVTRRRDNYSTASIPIILDPDWVRKRFLATDDHRHAEASHKGCVNLFKYDWRALCLISSEWD